MNTVISVCVALPAAYAFSRYRFLGDKQLFFWLLDQPHGPGRRIRLAVLPALFGRRAVRHASRGRARPLPVQHSACGLDPRRLHGRCPQRAGRDGLCRWLLLPAVLRDDLPAHDQGGRRRRSLLLLHVLLGRIAAGQDAHSRRRKTDCGHHDENRIQRGYELGLLAAAGTLTIIPGAIVIYFVRNYIAKGFALGRV